MNLTSATLLDESPSGVLYDLPVATDEFLTVEQARKTLGKRLLLAQDEKAPVNTVVTVHGHPQGVVVSVEWYRKMREQEGEPVNWQFAPPPQKPKRDEAAE